ncbi:sulfurtransferase [Devosia ginsengisoli]|uniref:Sulfurtransferase n=1 Tax=Devosia ginsengisoli TaxID=400770 RepID=A0A5B8LYH6_9HYPH|nr:sulfurtransferase [Devosia ginsengisoli]QDZ12734.1 sulfurtransferase [Devosia ginsengisoli]
MHLKLAGAAMAAALILTGAAHAERLTDQPLVDAAWLAQHLGNESLVVLDIRDATDAGDLYAAGHVPGAVAAPYAASGWRAKVGNVPGLLPTEEAIETLVSGLGVSNDSHVVILTGGANASDFGGATRVYWTFKVYGHDNVSILDGGYAAWAKANGELSTDAVTPVAATFDAEFRPELRAEVAEVNEAIASDVNLVDARSVAQFIGQEKTNTVQALGHIPSAININFDKFYDADKPAFASADIIAKLAKDAGVADSDGFIAFCNTGHLASIAWFGLSEVEGLPNVRLYDGSMSDWTSDPSRPVVTN